MPAQLSYAAKPAAGSPGLLYSQGAGVLQVSSFSAENALAFGDAVMAGTDGAKQVKKLALDATKFSGVAVYASEGLQGDGDKSYAAEDMAAVVQMGKVWVTAGGAVAVNEEVTPSVAAAQKFSKGTASDGAFLRAIARTAAAADGDLMLIELFMDIVAPTA